MNGEGREESQWLGRGRGLERDQHRRVQGLEESVQCAPVLLALRELVNLRDPTLLGLEVAGLRQQFPDVRCEDGPGMEEGPRGGWAGLTHLYSIARITSPPSWTCAGTCPESSAWPHSALCRPARSPRPQRVDAHSSASCQHLHPRCPPASPRGPVPDPRLPAE